VYNGKTGGLILDHVDMERITVELDLPRDLLGVLRGTEEELGAELKLLIVLELFREEKLSSGKAAQVAGLSKADFIDELGRRGIPYFTKTPEDWKRSLRTCESCSGIPLRTRKARNEGSVPKSILSVPRQVCLVGSEDVLVRKVGGAAIERVQSARRVVGRRQFGRGEDGVLGRDGEESLLERPVAELT